MNKSQLIDAVSVKSGLTKVDSKKAVEALLEITKDELKKGEKVTIIGFGTFSVIEKRARKGLNPRTNEPIEIPAKKSPKFKAGNDFIDAVK